jgi:hypothetical protein
VKFEALRNSGGMRKGDRLFAGEETDPKEIPLKARYWAFFS